MIEQAYTYISLQLVHRVSWYITLSTSSILLPPQLGYGANTVFLLPLKGNFSCSSIGGVLNCACESTYCFYNQLPELGVDESTQLL